MKSPFPGMDPYLERHWLDVHTRLVMYAADELNERLPGDLVARTEERIAVESDDFHGARRTIGPDVRIDQPGATERYTGGAAIAAPIKLVLDLDPITERFIRILDTGDGAESLITVIEFISPTNKTGRGLREYLKKRAELVRGGVNVVEIDLVRQGNWRRLLKPHRVATEVDAQYHVVIRAGGENQDAYLFPVSIRERLPEVGIPLRKNDPELKLDLQRLVDTAYARGRYGQTLHYDRPLSPPLSPEDTAWASERIRTVAE